MLSSLKLSFTSSFIRILYVVNVWVTVSPSMKLKVFYASFKSMALFFLTFDGPSWLRIRSSYARLAVEQFMTCSRRSSGRHETMRLLSRWSRLTTLSLLFFHGGSGVWRPTVVFGFMDHWLWFSRIEFLYSLCDRWTFSFIWWIFPFLA